VCGSSFDTVLAVYPSCTDEPLGCNDDSCGQQSQVVAILTAAQPYVIRVASRGGTVGGVYRLQVTPPATTPPSNNVCGGGTLLASNVPVAGNSAGASGNDSTGACGGTGDRADVWYSFNPAASGQHILELCTTAFDGVLSVHSSCFNSTILGCSDDDAVAGCPAGSGSRVVFNASAGVVVLVRVAGVDGSFGPYSIAVQTAAGNDLCANAFSATRGISYSGNLTPAIATEGTALCALSAGDVWYTFVPSLTGPHMFSLCNSPTDTVLSVHTGCPGASGAFQLACGDDGCTSGSGAAAGASQVVADVEVGQTYYVRIAGRVQGGIAATGPYTLRIDVAAPSNDSCTTPGVLTLGVPVTAITSGATGTDLTTCGGDDTRDVWYIFTPAQSGMYEFNTCGSQVNTTLALFSSCSVQLACSDDDPLFCGSGPNSSSRLTRAISAGATTLVRVAGTSGSSGPFRLVVNRTPPTNDTCGAAQAIVPGVAAAGTLSGATGTGTPDCTGTDSPDVYFAFTPQQTRYYRFTTCGSAAKTAVSVYSSCPPATALACSTTNDGPCGVATSTDLTTVLIAGTTHRVRVSSLQDEPGASFQIFVDIAAPPNDNCARPRALALDTFVSASTVGASGADFSPCGASDSLDVWFSFAPDLTGTYEFLTCTLAGAGSPDTTLALFDACGETATMLGCNDDSPMPGSCDGSPMFSRVSTRLTVGQTYLLRAAVVGGSEGSFTLGVRRARPTNDTCATARTIAEGATVFDTIGADSDPNIVLGCGGGFAQIPNDVWFRYVASQSGPVVVSTCASDFDTSLVVLDGQNGCTVSIAAVACDTDFDCDQNSGTSDQQSRAVFQAEGGRAYLFRVGSLSNARGAGELLVNRAGAPVCRCDWNRVNGRGLQDVFDFLIDWFAGRGDFNQSGVSDLQDLFDFLNCYLTNPPECR